MVGAQAGVGGRREPYQRERVWAALGLKPHLTKTFKLSDDPKFTAKVQDFRISSGFISTRPHALSQPARTKRWCCALMRRANPSPRSHTSTTADEEAPPAL